MRLRETYFTMNKILSNTLRGIAAAAVAFMSVTSCSVPKDVTYVQDLQPGTYNLSENEGTIKAMPGDRLKILVTSKDQALSSIFNLNFYSANGTSTPIKSGSTGSSTNTQTLDYTVDEKGNVEIPVLGPVHVEGLTRSQIAQEVKNQLITRNFLKDPTVVVEFANPQFSVLGEVATPGRKTLDRDHVTLLDAIAMAGDLTITGERTNVKLIRESAEGQRQVYVVDLTKGADLYASPAFYVQQNDVIYVEPIATRKRTRDPNGNVFQTAGFWMSMATFLMSIGILVFK